MNDTICKSPGDYTLEQLNQIHDTYRQLCDTFGNRSCCAPDEARNYLRQYDLTVWDLLSLMKHAAGVMHD